MKLANKTFTKNIFVSLVNNFILTKREGETKLYSLPIDRIWLFNYETQIILVKVLFACFAVL